MRRIALALLVAATGCNWVFGLQHTRPYDAAPDVAPGEPPPPDLTIQFDYQLGSTDGTGAPTAATALAISPAPMLQLGPIDASLMPATYDAATMAIRAPFALAGQPWRLVYTLDYDPVPREVQWSLKSAHLSLPWLQRPTDTAPPIASGYSITPNPVISLGAPTLLTTGSFTYTPVPNADRQPITGGTRVDFHYPTEALPVLGPRGTPSGALGDRVVLADWRFQSTGIYAINGFGVISGAELTANTLTPKTVTWVTAASPTISGISFNAVASSMRMSNNGIAGLGGTCCSYHLGYGALYNPNILPFVPDRSPTPSGLDVPLFASYYEYNSASAEPTSLQIPDPTQGGLPLPAVLYAQFTRPRIASGATLTTAFTVVTPVTMKNLAFVAPLATGVMFAGMTLMTGSMDNQQIPGSTGTMMLTWTPESGASIAVDDYVVTLYEIANNMLMPIRSYQVIDPKVSVEGMLFTAGHRYVFGITSRHGFPNIANGDYSVVSLPFAETTTFPLAFVIQ